VQLRSLIVVVAIAGSFSKTLACGARTGLGLVEVSSDAGTVVPPSCAPGGPGLTNCGASLETCCASLVVEGGTYFRTYFNSGSGPAGEADPATVSGFRLDKYLVTVGRFRQFVNAWNGGQGYTPPAGSGKHAYLHQGLGLANTGSPGTYEPGWVASDDGNIAPTNANLTCGSSASDNYSTWTASAGAQENLPIICETWQEAYAFCIWDGGFLPSEAEWEYAAAGGSEQREYPWGSADPGSSNHYAVYGDSDGNCYYPSGALAPCTGVVNIAPVGTATLGVARWGQLDMMGEVFEWNLDWYADYVDPSINGAYLKSTSARVDRGGTFEDAFYLLPPDREYYPPMSRNESGGIGFRCARAP